MIEGHGDDAYKYAGPIRANFSSNVCYDADLEGLKRYLCGRMEAIASYPEPEPYALERLLAERHGLDPGEVCATNGATEAIYLTAHCFRGSRTAILDPAFAEYGDACRLHGHRVVSVSSLEEIPADAQTVWLCNPNNPTGRVWERERLLRAIADRPGVLFVVDQSYEYFTLEPLLSAVEAAQLPNAVVLHSMTKRYSVPGLRLGYFTACRELTDRIRGCRMPWSVNALAAEAGCYLLREGMPERRSVADYLAGSRSLAAAIAAIDGFVPEPSDCHFMLVRMREARVGELKEWLAIRWGILIRDASNFRGLDGRYFRIAAQSPEQNELLIEALRQWR
ncbi:MAG: pyridoxal phosphate-dependent class II aminotransferase [Alistipes sp.]|nr:pyridoxal phosphate-dependent class II aminotransferase [Alistipes sp.]